jgi:HSP20 family molecular chaperone IbpA
MTQTGPIVLVLVAGVVLFAHAVAGRATGPESITSSELPVLVTETPERVRLRVLLPEDVPLGSVEIQLAGRNVVVIAQGSGGRQLRSRSLWLSEAAVEDGVQAAYESDGSLTITLRKARPGGP